MDDQFAWAADTGADRQLRETYLNKETIFSGKIIEVERWTVRLPDGKEALREVALHKGACAVVAVDEKGKVLLVRQHRVAAGEFTWEIPAGKLDVDGEAALGCAKRELLEETGCTADHWRHLTTMLTTPGFTNERIALFLATGLHEQEAQPDEGEFLTVRRVPLEEAVAAVTAGRITDGKSCVGLLMAARLFK